MGDFFPKVDEKYGDGNREYNWWDCSYSESTEFIGVNQRSNSICKRK